MPFNRAGHEWMYKSSSGMGNTIDFDPIRNISWQVQGILTYDF